MSDLKKQLRIKFGVAHRTKKELASYIKEGEKQSAKIAKMREDGADEYDIRKQLEVLAETEAMIPDTKSRLTRALEDLEEFMDVNGEDASLEGFSKLAEARALLKEAGLGGAEEEEEDAAVAEEAAAVAEVSAGAGAGTGEAAAAAPAAAATADDA